MKYFAIVAAVLALAACKDDKGVHLGTFKEKCSAKNGVLAQVTPNEYTCTLPDGTVLKTQAK